GFLKVPAFASSFSGYQSGAQGRVTDRRVDVGFQDAALVVTQIASNTYSCCASRMISAFSSPSPTTNSSPVSPGTIVMNDVVPSGSRYQRPEREGARSWGQLPVA